MPARVARFHLFAVVAASAFVACTTLAISNDPLHPARFRGAPLTRGEFAALNVSNAAEAIGRLRPEFLRGSGLLPPAGNPELAVYENDVYSGDASALSMIPVAAIDSISFLDPVSAYTRFGPRCRCANGAIVVAVLGRR